MYSKNKRKLITLNYHDEKFITCTYHSDVRILSNFTIIHFHLSFSLSQIDLTSCVRKFRKKLEILTTV